MWKAVEYNTEIWDTENLDSVPSFVTTLFWVSYFTIILQKGKQKYRDVMILVTFINGVHSMLQNNTKSELGIIIRMMDWVFSHQDFINTDKQKWHWKFANSKH